MNKEGKQNKNISFLPLESIFAAAQSHRMESWGMGKKGDFAAAALALPVSRPLRTPLSPPPILPVMTIFIEFKN